MTTVRRVVYLSGAGGGLTKTRVFVSGDGLVDEDLGMLAPVIHVDQEEYTVQCWQDVSPDTLGHVYTTAPDRAL